MVPQLPDERREPLRGQGGRALRRLQRFALAQHDRTGGPRLHPGPAAHGLTRCASAADAILIGEPRHRDPPAAERAGAADGAAGQPGRDGADADVAARGGAGSGPTLRDRARGLAAAAYRGGTPRRAGRRRHGAAARRRDGDRPDGGRWPDRASRGRAPRARARRARRNAGGGLAARGGAAGVPRGGRTARGGARTSGMAAITLRDPRSRWGSCSPAGDLMFSWRLVMAPAAVLDYVVAHEVAHLAEMNHSTRFWAVVRRLCPDHAPAREWLRRHGASLHGHRLRRAALDAGAAARSPRHDDRARAPAARARCRPTSGSTGRCAPGSCTDRWRRARR